MQYTLLAKDKNSEARCGVLTTAHGGYPYSYFYAGGDRWNGESGTCAGIKRGYPGQEIILGNTYHLYLRPGTEVLQAAGGLHRFSLGQTDSDR